MVGIPGRFVLFFGAQFIAADTRSCSHAAGARLRFSPCLLLRCFFAFLSPLASPFLPLANDVTGNPATQASSVPDKRIIVLSQLGKFALFIRSAQGRLNEWNVARRFGACEDPRM